MICLMIRHLWHVAEYRTISGVSGPLVVADGVKVGQLLGQIQQ
jgi:hypothetical protein